MLLFQASGRANQNLQVLRCEEFKEKVGYMKNISKAVCGNGGVVHQTPIGI